MRLDSLLQVVFGLLISSSVFGKDECPSNIRGESIHWVVAVCEKRSETDDFELPSVQKCIADTIAKDKLERVAKHNCKLNADYKKEWCEIPGEASKEAASNCFASPTILPRVVLEGGVGG